MKIYSSELVDVLNGLIEVTDEVLANIYDQEAHLEIEGEPLSDIEALQAATDRVRALLAEVAI